MDLDTEVEPEAAPSRRDAIEAAFEAAEAPEAPVEVITPEPVETKEPEAKPERTAAEKARDEAGRFAKAPKVTVKPTLAKPKDPAAVAPVKPTQAPAKGVATAVQTSAQPAAEAAALKAPASWKPAARERWASLPPEVQQEAHRRERETQQALQESSEARRSWGSFQQAVAPYAGMIQAEGSNPVQAAAALFQTAAALRTAPAPTKAAIVADLVRTYGIDIQMLDDALAGKAPRPAQGQAQPQQFRDPRFDQFLQQLESEKHQRQQSQAQQHAQEVAEFGSNAEFFDDVRQDMADILEVAARRGVAMSLEDAYSRAVNIHPEVSEVMAQREKAKAATASQATMQRTRAAASSVKSRPSGPAPTQAPASRRAAIEAALDAHSR